MITAYTALLAALVLCLPFKSIHAQPEHLFCDHPISKMKLRDYERGRLSDPQKRAIDFERKMLGESVWFIKRARIDGKKYHTRIDVEVPLRLSSEEARELRRYRAGVMSDTLMKRFEDKVRKRLKTLGATVCARIEAAREKWKVQHANEFAQEEQERLQAAADADQRVTDMMRTSEFVQRQLEQQNLRVKSTSKKIVYEFLDDDGNVISRSVVPKSEFGRWQDRVEADGYEAAGPHPSVLIRGYIGTGTEENSWLRGDP